MNVWNKVFLGLIGVTSLAFFYFGARVLSVQKSYRDRSEKVAGAESSRYRVPPGSVAKLARSANRKT